MNFRISFLVFALLALIGCQIRTESKAETVASICEPVMYEDSPLTHCIADPARHAIAMDLAPKGSDRPYRSLKALADDLPDAGAVALAMNGGMYDGEGNPIGYYVEDGRRLAQLNENDGPGNFHLLPNGVFYGDSRSGWTVRETRAFGRTVTDRPDFATQSGPMLVIDGDLHPAFDPDGDSRKIRNAVGVDPAGRAHFVITRAPVSFGKLARFYRDVLGVRNALFLDGSVSQIWDPARGRMDAGPQIGPIIVVRNQENGE